MKPIVKEFKNIPAGNHAAYCIKIIDIGHQEIKNFSSPGTRIVPQAVLCFETPFEKMDDGRPMIIYTFPWTVSTHEKSKFAQAMQALNGSPISQDFWGKTIMGQANFEGFLGKACQIEVIEKPGKNGGVFANIKDVHPLPKGMTLPPMENKPLYFDLDNPNEEAFKSLPEWIKTEIETSGVIKSTPKADDDLNDEVIF